MKKMAKVFISGPVTPGAEAKFRERAELVLRSGNTPMNPAEKLKGKFREYAEGKITASDYLNASLPVLLSCSHITQISGWEQDEAAVAEHATAKTTSKIFLKIIRKSPEWGKD